MWVSSITFKRHAQGAMMLLENDPAENVNISGEVEHQAQVKQLSQLLNAGWKGVLP